MRGIFNKCCEERGAIMKEYAMDKLQFPRKILILDLLANLGWIFSDILTNLVIGRSDNILMIVTSKTVMITLLVGFASPFLKRRFLIPAIINWRKNPVFKEKILPPY